MLKFCWELNVKWCLPIDTMDAQIFLGTQCKIVWPMFTMDARILLGTQCEMVSDLSTQSRLKLSWELNVKLCLVYYHNRCSNSVGSIM